MLSQLFSHKNNLLLKIIFSYILVGMILLSLFSYILTSRVSEQMTKDVHEATVRTINQSYNTADILLTTTYDYFFQQYKQEPLISDALYRENFNSQHTGQIGAKLQELPKSNRLVDSIYIYNSKAELVFSSLATVRKTDAFYDRDLLRMLTKEDLTSLDIFTPRKVTYDIFNKTYTKNLITIVFSEVNSGSSVDAAMIVNLDQQVFQNMVTKPQNSAASNAMIVNRNGIIVSHTDSALINQNVYSDEYIGEILKSGNKTGRFIDTVNGHKSLITFVKPERLGWSFIGIHDYSQLLGKINILKRTILFITVIFVFLAILMSLLFTNIIYSPLYKLLKKIKKAKLELDVAQPLNEYDYLSCSLDTLLDNVHTLQSNIKQNLHFQKKDALQKIIRGSMSSSEDIRSIAEKHELNLTGPYFVCCTLSLDDFHRLRKSYTPDDLTLLKYCVINISGEIIGARYTCEIIDESDDLIVVILNMDDLEHDWEGELNRIGSEIMLNCGKYLKLSLTMSVGTPADTADSIKDSFEEAADAANYRIVHGTNSIIHYSAAAAAVKEDFNYPLSIESKVMDALKQGDMDKLDKAFEEFSQSIGGYEYNEMMLALLQLVVMTIRTAKTMTGEGRNDPAVSHNNIHKELYRLDTLDQIKDWYMNLCAAFIRTKNERFNRKNEVIIQKIMQYIDENFPDPNLSVDGLAEMAKLSTNYLRRIFKEAANQTISNYITEVRFNKAKELLVNTDFPANKIGELVGIDNSGYFYIAFKKHFGQTPIQFRSAHSEIQTREA